jgi:hypothetical protein
VVEVAVGFDEEDLRVCVSSLGLGIMRGTV